MKLHHLNILKLRLLSAYENCYLVEFVELDKVLSEFLFVHKLVQLVIRWMPWLYLQKIFSFNLFQLETEEASR